MPDICLRLLWPPCVALDTFKTLNLRVHNVLLDFYDAHLLGEPGNKDILITYSVIALFISLFRPRAPAALSSVGVNLACILLLCLLHHTHNILTLALHL